MASDQSLLDAYRKQCRILGPWKALLLWDQSGEVLRGEVERDDLIDISKDVAEDMVAEGADPLSWPKANAASFTRDGERDG